MLTIGSALVLCAFFLSGRAAAQTAAYDNRNLNGCVRSFYDPDFYNWFAFENSCGDAITIVFGKRGGHRRVEGAMTIGPGRKDNIGRNRSEIAEWAGVEWYVCVVCMRERLPVGSER